MQYRPHQHIAVRCMPGTLPPYMVPEQLLWGMSAESIVLWVLSRCRYTNRILRIDLGFHTSMWMSSEWQSGLVVRLVIVSDNISMSAFQITY